MTEPAQGLNVKISDEELRAATPTCSASPTRARSSSSTSSTWCPRRASLPHAGHQPRPPEAHHRRLEREPARYEQTYGLIQEAPRTCGGEGKRALEPA